jgi:hypothetical protein
MAWARAEECVKKITCYLSLDRKTVAEALGGPRMDTDSISRHMLGPFAEHAYMTRNYETQGTSVHHRIFHMPDAP